MNGKLMKYAAYGIGAAVLLAGSFFLFAALSGTPMSEMKGVGAAFPDEEEAPPTASKELPHPQDELDADRRSAEQVLVESASPLKAFLLPSGFSAQELADLERELERRIAELDVRSRDLDDRERLLEQDRQLYDELFAELETLRASLVEQSLESEARAEELDAQRDALEQSKRRDFANAAKSFYSEASGAKPDDLAARLMLHDPADAALILVALPDERAGALVTAVMKKGGADKAKELEFAYMAAKAGAPAK